MMNTGTAARTIKGALLAGLLLLAGCAATVPVKVLPIVGISLYPPTNPAAIMILQASPVRPHQTLAQVVLEPGDTLSPAEMEQLLRDSAAAMGAHAVVVLANMKMQAGANWFQRGGGHVISAVAIRYTD